MTHLNTHTKNCSTLSFLNSYCTFEYDLTYASIKKQYFLHVHTLKLQHQPKEVYEGNHYSTYTNTHRRHHLWVN